MACYRHYIVPRAATVTLQWPLLFLGIRADVSETPDKALTTWMHGDYRLSIDRFFVGFNVICYTFLGNNPISIEGHNSRWSTVPGLFNKWSGLRLSDTSSWWLGWRRHVRVGEPFFGKSLDLSFQSFTIVVLTIYLYWIKGILRGYLIRSGRRPLGSQRTCGPPWGRWLPSDRLPDRIAYQCSVPIIYPNVCYHYTDPPIFPAHFVGAIFQASKLSHLNSRYNIDFF